MYYDPLHNIHPRFCATCFFGDQVETILTLRDSDGDSLLALAAASGDKATFESVLTTVQEKLGPEQVK